MKRTPLIMVVLLLALMLLIGCGKSTVEEASTPVAETTAIPAGEPTAEPTLVPTAVPTGEPTMEPTAVPTAEPTAVPTAEPTIVPTTQPGNEPPLTEEYEGDATTHYRNNIYPDQIECYYTALSQQWDEWAYMDNGMSAMAAYYYEGSPLDNVGFTFMDLDNDGVWELIIGAILNSESSPLLFEIWGLKNNEPTLLAQSGSRNRYYLRYAVDDELWSVAYEGENGAANNAVYYLQLVDGEFQVNQGVIFDAVASEQAPWFMTYDLDWDVSNDTPIDEQTAISVMDAGRRIYAAAEYCPYSLYK